MDPVHGARKIKRNRRHNRHRPRTLQSLHDHQACHARHQDTGGPHRHLFNRQIILLRGRHLFHHLRTYCLRTQLYRVLGSDSHQTPRGTLLKKKTGWFIKKHTGGSGSPRGRVATTTSSPQASGRLTVGQLGSCLLQPRRARNLDLDLSSLTLFIGRGHLNLRGLTLFTQPISTQRTRTRRQRKRSKIPLSRWCKRSWNTVCCSWTRETCAKPILPTFACV